MPEFLSAYPGIAVDLHLSDAMVDLIGEGFDAALRIASLPDSSLIARRLCGVEAHVLAAPAYLKSMAGLGIRCTFRNMCVSYAYLATADTWRFTNKSGEVASLRPAGPLRVNNGDAILPALIAGVGLGVLPDFIAGPALADGRLEAVLTDWSLPSAALHLVMPPGGPRPARVEVLGDFLARKLARRGHEKA